MIIRARQRAKTKGPWTIYKITNRFNGKIYIGKTTKEDVEERLAQHEHRFGTGSHGNHFMQADFDAGEWDPVIRAIDEFDDSEEARLAEDDYVKEVPLKKSYNIVLRRKGPPRRVFTPEQREQGAQEARELIARGVKQSDAFKQVAVRFNCNFQTVGTWVNGHPIWEGVGLRYLRKQLNKVA